MHACIYLLSPNALIERRIHGAGQGHSSLQQLLRLREPLLRSSQPMVHSPPQNLPFFLSHDSHVGSPSWRLFTRPATGGAAVYVAAGITSAWTAASAFAPAALRSELLTSPSSAISPQPSISVLPRSPVPPPTLPSILARNDSLTRTPGPQCSERFVEFQLPICDEADPESFQVYGTSSSITGAAAEGTTGSHGSSSSVRVALLAEECPPVFVALVDEMADTPVLEAVCQGLEEMVLSMPADARFGGCLSLLCRPRPAGCCMHGTSILSR